MTVEQLTFNDLLSRWRRGQIKSGQTEFFGINGWVKINDVKLNSDGKQVAVTLDNGKTIKKLTTTFLRLRSA